MEKLFLRVEEAAELLSLGRSKVYQLIAAGELRAVKIGRATRVPTEAVREYAKRQVAQQRSGAA